MKNLLTVTGSGCVALGHPARPPYWLPENTTGTTADAAFENPSGAKNAPMTAGRASEADTLEQEDSRSLAREACARSEVLLGRCRADAVSDREIAVAPSAAAR
jgi:hypothetical protein